jgi:hypothetical protein
MNSRPPARLVVVLESARLPEHAGLWPSLSACREQLAAVCVLGSAPDADTSARWPGEVHPLVVQCETLADAATALTERDLTPSGLAYWCPEPAAQLHTFFPAASVIETWLAMPAITRPSLLVCALNCDDSRKGVIYDERLTQGLTIGPLDAAGFFEMIFHRSLRQSQVFLDSFAFTKLVEAPDTSLAAKHWLTRLSLGFERGCYHLPAPLVRFAAASGSASFDLNREDDLDAILAAVRSWPEDKLHRMVLSGTFADWGQALFRVAMNAKAASLLGPAFARQRPASGDTPRRAAESAEFTRLMATIVSAIADDSSPPPDAEVWLLVGHRPEIVRARLARAQARGDTNSIFATRQHLFLADPFDFANISAVLATAIPAPAFQAIWSGRPKPTNHSSWTRERRSEYLRFLVAQTAWPEACALVREDTAWRTEESRHLLRQLVDAMEWVYARKIARDLRKDLAHP